MKLTPSVDLAPIRAAALDRVDLAFLPRLAPSPLAAAYDEKARRARVMLDGGDADPAIIAEAGHRDLTPEALARVILFQAEVAANTIMRAEAARQTAKARVRAAPHQHAILAILAEIEA